MGLITSVSPYLGLFTWIFEIDYLQIFVLIFEFDYFSFPLSVWIFGFVSCQYIHMFTHMCLIMLSISGGYRLVYFVNICIDIWDWLPNQYPCEYLSLSILPISVLIFGFDYFVNVCIDI